MTDVLLWLHWLSLLPFALFGLHRLVLLHLARRYAPQPPVPVVAHPFVTVQLPVFNERYAVEGLLRAVARLDYPRDRFEIQLLDDSTDDTSDIAARVIASLPADVTVTHVRRRDRSGYKAGALAAALPAARGDLMAVFDADFRPPPRFLADVVGHFADARVGLVQCRWGYRPFRATPLAWAQVLLIDAHFAIEHVARSAGGHFFNFNGTAGVWRRTAIEEAGGWQSDTLTEDLDLSYRAQLAGWRFVYRPDVVVPSELPSDIRAFKNQQYRWSKGMTQVARKLLPAVWRAPVSASTKVHASLHLVSNAGFPFAALMSLVTLPTYYVHGFWIGDSTAWTVASTVLLATNFLTLGVFFGVAATRGHPGGASGLARLVALFPVGFALSVVGSMGMLSALLRRPSAFVRTPKRGAMAHPTPERYRLPASSSVWVEAGFAAYHAAWGIVIVVSGRLDLVWFTAILLPGYVYFGGLEIRASRSASKGPEHATPRGVPALGETVIGTSSRG